MQQGEPLGGGQIFYSGSALYYFVEIIDCFRPLCGDLYEDFIIENSSGGDIHASGKFIPGMPESANDGKGHSVFDLVHS